MNKRVTSLYVCMVNNKVIAFGNLKDVIDKLSTLDSTTRNYMWYYRKFKETKYFKEGDYFFQRLV